MTTVREKKINWTSSNLKLLSFKGHNQESKKNPHNGKKIFENLISDNGLVFRISKVFVQLNNRKTNNSIKN